MSLIPIPVAKGKELELDIRASIGEERIYPYRDCSMVCLPWYIQYREASRFPFTPKSAFSGSLGVRSSPFE